MVKQTKKLQQIFRKEVRLAITPERYVLKIHSNVESGQKMIQFNINSKFKSDGKIYEMVHRTQEILHSSSVDTNTHLSQAYKRNSTDLNCKRHMSVFDNHKIIPEHCFGCYKVQVEPNTLIELLRIFLVFDQVSLNNNNTRKCMIELRPEIPGFYKGLVYCSGLDEAIRVSNQLNLLLKKYVNPSLVSQVKRGCSEFSLIYPSYNEINDPKRQSLSYNEDWKSIEIQHDRAFPIKRKVHI